ncbi:hypothetical protein Cob_v002242 [Colletotrichum orbiculare MAFF 240422]|uniref:Uncharacterized protein n=1 Tax=Colletotrichum orbiculare (strain 104-T / ATCC 96160 / CBS 514.97 / LARS 414 / MAFF 240422) TaxID=1213857 RepID=A0A484G3P5_COLOR|nr:hypothetical protein Cob_v002242 [Colletotrichum orbiculare MAFF 240422]
MLLLALLSESFGTYIQMKLDHRLLLLCTRTCLTNLSVKTGGRHIYVLLWCNIEMGLLTSTSLSANHRIIDTLTPS